MKVYIGTAAWTIPRIYAESFLSEGSHLSRYALELPCAEINTSFKNTHKLSTYERWAESVPTDFRFSVKLSKALTHDQRMGRGEVRMADVLQPMQGLGKKWGCLLVQIPPSLAFEKKVSRLFWEKLRDCFEGPVAFEARHESWVTDESIAILEDHKISLVQADPDPFAELEYSRPKSKLVYLRLHGSPQMYRSDYDKKALQVYKNIILKNPGKTVWCIFDNTTLGFGTKNALELKRMLHSSRRTR